MRKTTQTIVAGLALLTLSAAAPAGEQQPPQSSSAKPYPAGRAIEMTVMFGAGSAADVTARYLADGMSKFLSVPVPVVNRTGGGGAIGYSHLKQQKPDGYSIIWNSNSISTTYHSGTLPFDYTEFDAIARVSVETTALAIRADAPWKTLPELLHFAKENPSKVRVGNSGTGSHTHYSAAALFTLGGAKAIDVPFGEGQAMVNLLGGRIEAVVQMPAALVAQVKSGDLRVLAVMGSKRDPIFPDVPTASELGFPLSFDLWRGIATPKGTPKPVIAKLEDAVKRTVESKAFKDAGVAVGFTPAFLPAHEFHKVIASDDTRLAQVMADLGLKKSR
jgi:tripartite-type tricarboxylate transporter receptor subunit TctC